MSENDVAASEDAQLGAAAESAIAQQVESDESSIGREALARSDPRFAQRADFLESEAADPMGFERIIGTSNLLSINFLDRGRRAADAVCRIRVPMAGGFADATGVLIGPRLLLTNNHVIANRAEATQAFAEFGYQADIDGVVDTPLAFNLDAQAIFYTSPDLDFTLIGVVPLSTTGVPLERFGWLPLVPLTGKAIDGEAVTIIQHPGGLPKQIAIHASHIVVLDPADVPDVDLDRFIHYSSDTEPGSSGAPVLNDQWQIVALHHKSVPARSVRPGAPTRWIANEGVRISAIYRHLETNRFLDGNAALALDRMTRALGFLPLSTVPARPDAGFEQRSPLPLARWERDDLGYDPGFLTTPIALETIYASARAGDRVAPLLDGSGHELKYWHFSAVIDSERKFPLLTAVNIDGRKLRKVGRKDSWRRDARMADEYQPDDALYARAGGTEPVYFSRGHQVRLLDACWGENDADALRGMEDTFHFTNCAPQVQTFNDSDWGDLEDYVLDKAQTSSKRLSVFTGPIFRPDDPFYGRMREGGPWRIPLSYWKIAVLQKTDTRIAAAAFIIGQVEYVRALYEERVFTGLHPYTIEELRDRHIQTTIDVIERETGLDFGVLKPFDTQGSLESTRATRFVTQLSDVVI